MKSLLLIAALFFSLLAFSQRGKDGTVTITTAGSIVNLYTPLTSNATSGSTSISVGSTASYNIGDLVMVMQMQGAGIRASWDNISGDVTNSIPENSTHGDILAYNNCGNYEFAEITDVPNSTTLVLDCGLKYNYDVTYVTTANPFPYGITIPGNIQVIKVPRYAALTVSGAGSLSCPSWNGKTGGVVVVEVQNNATLNSSPSFDATGKGFRGGSTETNLTSNFGGQKWGSLKTAEGAYKGESIAGDTNVYRLYSSLYGKGALANGGGGGTSHNSGGGGGANGGVTSAYTGNGNPVTGYTASWNLESAGFATSTSSGGGRGGYTFSNSNKSVTTVAPGNTQWGGDYRRIQGGMGGRPVDYSTGRLFLGGGGGAGDGNDGRAGAGGNGGGMVYVVCYGNLTGAGTIVADGANGASSIPGCSANDAGGGAGGGGTIVLNVNGTTNLTATTPLSAKGGAGGNVTFNCALSNSDSYGPAGGGGGGYISTSGTLPANNIAGGANGIETGNTSNIAASFPPNGATKGGNGSTGSISNYTLTVSSSPTVCANQSFSVSASSTEPGTSVNWFNTIVGGTALASGSVYNSTGYSSPGTYTLFAGVCPGTYRQPVLITVNSGLSISVNSPTVCAGQSAILTPTSTATSYSWSTTQTTNTISVSPASTTVYTVTGTTGGCIGMQTATVTVGGSAGITVNSPTICAGSTAILSAGGASSYTWNTGAHTSTISVSPASITVYTVTGSAGTCTGSATSTVSINALPTLTVNASPASLCAGAFSTLTVTGANTYTWSNSANGNTQIVGPTTTTTYSVSGTNSAGCTNTVIASTTVSITPNPTITVNSPTICAGQAAVLTASGATTYSWNTSQTTNSISVSPAVTTIYTVTGTASSCSQAQTATVTVSPAMIILVNSPTICAGQAAVLSATSSATSYTWSTGQNTGSISVSPTATTEYTVVGASGTCAGLSTTTVTVKSVPTITLTATPPDICAGQSTTLTATGATSYTWSNSFNGSSQTLSPATSTTYSVSGTGASGCANATPFTITVNVTPTPVISANSATVCSGSGASLTAIGATSYTWNTGETSASINPHPATTTAYTVSGSNGGCSTDFVTTVYVTSSPTLSAVGNFSTGCTQLCTSFQTFASANSSVSYQFGDGTSSSSLTPTHCYQSVGIYTVTVTATDPVTGCMSTYVLPTTMHVFQTPVAMFTISEGTVVPVGSTINFINTSTGASSYTWIPCQGPLINTKDLVLTDVDTGRCCMELSVLSIDGCPARTHNCYEVIHDASLSIPNVFTPNGDSKNDLFKITTNGIKNLSCSIFDRWGLKMYEWDGINGYWDGKSKTGVPVVDGSYFYIINYTDFKDVSKTEKGFLSLFRN